MADSSQPEPVTKVPLEDLGWRPVRRSDENLPLRGTGEFSIDLMKKESPADYQLVLKLCELALTHYQNSHPGESYEFESLLKGFYTPVQGIEFSLTFRAKKSDGNTVETYQAVGYALVGEGLKIGECTLLK